MARWLAQFSSLLERHFVSLRDNDGLCHCVTIVSLRNRTTERRGRQSAHV